MVRLDDIANVLVTNWPYRRARGGEWGWGGGEHSVLVYCADTPAVSAGSRRVWSRNRKWKSLNSWAVLCCTAQAVEVFGRNNLLVTGKIVLDAELIEPRVYRAVWLEQARRFSLKPVAGFIVRGNYVASDDLARAKKRVARIRKAQACALLEKRRDLRT